MNWEAITAVGELVGAVAAPGDSWDVGIGPSFGQFRKRVRWPKSHEFAMKLPTPLFLIQNGEQM